MSSSRTVPRFRCGRIRQLGRIMDVLGRPIDEAGARTLRRTASILPRRHSTNLAFDGTAAHGIKVIDLVPFPRRPKSPVRRAASARREHDELINNIAKSYGATRCSPASRATPRERLLPRDGRVEVLDKVAMVFGQMTSSRQPSARGADRPHHGREVRDEARTSCFHRQHLPYTLAGTGSVALLGRMPSAVGTTDAGDENGPSAEASTSTRSVRSPRSRPCIRCR